ncbi:MAG: type II/IV secretion system ATPase subunit [Erysipelotrichales bacterium]|nr:type II/IV secretion system ATPase subunit [Erysipelotrichales bacterium]
MTFDFRSLTPYINDDLITDINYNGRELWLDHLDKGRFVDEGFIMDESVEKFCYRFANYANVPFNVANPIVESESEAIRISIIHESVAKSGYSISIRKTPAVLRLKRSDMTKKHYASSELLDLLEQLVKSHCNILVCGLPGAGKTELVKYLTTFIPSNERVITIEDTLEIHYANINTHKDSVELKVNQHFSYVDAIKASLRQRPNWLLLSEVRSHEVVQLLEAVSTGAKLISTIHADTATNIPSRLLHMFPGVELSNKMILESIYESIDIGIHVSSNITDNGITRQINEVIYYEYTSNMETKQYVIYTSNEGIKQIPESLQKKLSFTPKKVGRKKKC